LVYYHNLLGKKITNYVSWYYDEIAV